MMLFGKEDADMRKDESEGGELGDINVGDHVHYHPSATTSTSSAAPPVTGSSALKTAALMGLAAISGGGLAALAPVAISAFTSKPATAPVVPKFEAPNWDLEVVPQEPEKRNP